MKSCYKLADRVRDERGEMREGSCVFPSLARLPFGSCHFGPLPGWRLAMAWSSILASGMRAEKSERDCCIGVLSYELFASVQKEEGMRPFYALEDAR